MQDGLESHLKRVFKLLISWVVYSADVCRVAIASSFGRQMRGCCAVLYYHEVAKSDRNRFAAQLDVICHEATPISALALQTITNGRNYVAITIDDAFISFFENGLPELERRQIPVLVFVPTAWLGRKADWVWEEEMTSPNERIATLDELKEFSAHPLVRFGSHTATHRKLSQLSDGEALKELVESKDFLERALGVGIDAISFPYGGFTDRDVRQAEQVGYKTLFTTLPKIAQNPSEGIIGRFRLDPCDGLLETKLKVAGAYRWQSAVRLLLPRARRIAARADAGVSAHGSA